MDISTGAVSIVLVTLFVGYVYLCRRRNRRSTVCVLVLGDFGRSPRMQYHTASLLDSGACDVDVVAFGGSDPISKIQNRTEENVRWRANNRESVVRLHYLTPVPRLRPGRPRICFLLYAPIKVVVQIAQLLWILLFRIEGSLSHIIVQNPPSIPTLTVAWFVCKIRFASFVIDWHNYGHTILALALKPGHWLVRVAERIERIFGRLGDANLCVTDAMRKDLINNWNIAAKRIATFHDRPPAMYRPTPVDVREDLFARLQAEQSDTGVVFRRAFAVAAERNENRPAILVSSTSWTADEDFGILLKALNVYDRACAKSANALPTLLCVITGKGPQRAHYERMMRNNPMQHVFVATAWLSFDDYPLLLGSADVGISLHKSSSNLDLPMKVVDMFGCGLPVCAINFDCLAELVRHDENGLVFDDYAELSAQLQRLLSGTRKDLARFRRALRGFREDGWSKRWNRIVRPLLFPRVRR